MADGYLDHIDLMPDQSLRTLVGASAGWRALGLRSWEKARALAPVSHEQMAQGQYGPARQGGGLRSSMKVRFFFGSDPRIEIGSDLQTESRSGGADPVNLFALIELGTPSHSIDPIAPNQLLRFVAGGTVVFTGHVDHPGTKKNPFVERAMQQTIHEAMGATLVEI